MWYYLFLRVLLFLYLVQNLEHVLRPKVFIFFDRLYLSTWDKKIFVDLGIFSDYLKSFLFSLNSFYIHSAINIYSYNLYIVTNFPQKYSTITISLNHMFPMETHIAQLGAIVCIRNRYVKTIINSDYEIQQKLMLSVVRLNYIV